MVEKAKKVGEDEKPVKRPVPKKRFERKPYQETKKKDIETFDAFTQTVKTEFPSYQEKMRKNELKKKNESAQEKIDLISPPQGLVDPRKTFTLSSINSVKQTVKKYPQNKFFHV